MDAGKVGEDLDMMEENHSAQDQLLVQ